MKASGEPSRPAGQADSLKPRRGEPPAEGRDRWDGRVTADGRITPPKRAKKPRSRHRGTGNKGVSRDGKKIAAAKERELREYFLQGLTSYKASRLVGCDRKTAAGYFNAWADELVGDESRETWADREERVRARMLETITERIYATHVRLEYLEGIFGGLMKLKKPDHGMIVLYNRQINESTSVYQEQLAEKYAIETEPPANVMIDREIERAIAEKQRDT